MTLRLTLTRQILLCLEVLVFTLTLCVATPAAAWSAKSAKVTTAFRQDCEDLLLREIERADTQILVAAYSLTNRDVVEALKKARERYREEMEKARNGEDYDSRFVCGFPGMKIYFGEEK